MTIKANGTEAKDIALHFLEVTEGRYTQAIIAKTINQAKNLLKAGYSKDEIIKTIDYIVDNTDVKMYSIGYINSCINDVLRKIKEENKEEELEKLRKKLEQEKEEFEKTQREEVDVDNESQQRNKSKLGNLGIQSRKREKSYLDMLKE